MTAPPGATGGEAHVDTAAVCAHTARRAALGVCRRAQVIHLGEGGPWEINAKEKIKWRDRKSVV